MTKTGVISIQLRTIVIEKLVEKSAVRISRTSGRVKNTTVKKISQ